MSVFPSLFSSFLATWLLSQVPFDPLYRADRQCHSIKERLVAVHKGPRLESMAGWGKLLKWSLTQSDTGNTANVGEGGEAGDAAAAAPPAAPRTEEERAWLSSAMQSLTVDEAARMRELGQALQAMEEVDLPAAPADLAAHPAVAAAEARLAQRKLAALEELGDLVEGIDNAKDLFMVGAVGPLLDAVRGVAPVLVAGSGAGAAEAVARVHGSTPPEVRAQACQVLATTLQNNPAAQAWAMGVDTLPALLGALAAQGVPLGGGLGALRAGAAGALSALLRDCAAAQAALLLGSGSGEGCPGLAACGMAALTAALQHPARALQDAPARKLQRRAAALLRHLAGGYHPEHALTGLVLAGTAGAGGGGHCPHFSPPAPAAGPAPSALQALLALLALHPSPDLPDVADTRTCALACLLAAALPAQAMEAVFDTQDSRAPRGLYDGQRAPGSGGSADAAPGSAGAATAATSASGTAAGAATASSSAVTTLGAPLAPMGSSTIRSGGGGGACTPVLSTTPLPSGQRALLTLQQRRAALRAIGVERAVSDHLAWCDAMQRDAAAAAAGGGGAMDESDGQGGGEDCYSVEAEQCRALLAALAPGV